MIRDTKPILKTRQDARYRLKLREIGIEPYFDSDLEVVGE